MELTPELFEKTEFAERRKGYDIEQVETFMEDAGTALAQMLARVRHTEERAAHSEARLAQVDELLSTAEARVAAAEQRAQAAERAAAEARSAAAQAAAHDETAEVEQAAKTLLMAKRTAEATVNEARGQAQALLEDAQHRAQRQLDEAAAESREAVQQATERAEAEFAHARATAMSEVQDLETRRMQLADVISQLEARLAGYRVDLERAAQELIDLAEDPQRLGQREAMSVVPDEIISAEAVDPADDDASPAQDSSGEPAAAEAGAPEQAVRSDSAQVDDADDTDDASPTGDQRSSSADADLRAAGGSEGARAAAISGEGSSGATATVVAEQPTDYVDLTRSAGPSSSDSDQWAPGSWAQVEAELGSEEDLDSDPRSTAAPGDDRPTEAVARAEAPRDRFLEELDSAVNEAVELDDDAMTAFFEGTGETRSRRFGWRR